MAWIETQLRQAQERIEYLFRWVQRLQDQLRAANQGVQAAFQQFGDSTPSNDTDVFFADHLNIAACPGLLTVATPTSTTGDVYKIAGGAFVLVASGATIWNGLPDPTDNTKRQILGSNGDSTYTVKSESCTAP